MDRSPYVTMALQALQQQPTAPQTPGPDISAMAGALKERRAWEAANPGQSYGKMRMGQIGQNIRNLPKTLAMAPVNAAQSIAQLPGEAMGGLMSLGRSILGR